MQYPAAAVCPQCGQRFPTPQQLAAHNAVAHLPTGAPPPGFPTPPPQPGIGQPACKTCGQMFPTTQQLIAHIQSTHLTPKPATPPAPQPLPGGGGRVLPTTPQAWWQRLAGGFPRPAATPTVYNAPRTGIGGQPRPFAPPAANTPWYTQIAKLLGLAR